MKGHVSYERAPLRGYIYLRELSEGKEERRRDLELEGTS
jgi:hypothetical protein